MDPCKHGDFCERNSKAREFYEAAVCGGLETLRTLLEPSIDINAQRKKSSYTMTALYAVTASGRMEMMRFHLADGADPGADTTVDRAVPLHTAAHNCQLRGYSSSP